jgi:hypothetical protein
MDTVIPNTRNELIILEAIADDVYEYPILAWEVKDGEVVRPITVAGMLIGESMVYNDKTEIGFYLGGYYVGRTECLRALRTEKK